MTFAKKWMRAMFDFLFPSRADRGSVHHAWRAAVHSHRNETARNIGMSELSSRISTEAMCELRGEPVPVKAGGRRAIDELLQQKEQRNAGFRQRRGP